MTFLHDFYRCHPNTRFEKTHVTILKHYKHYPLLFHIAVKIFKEIPSGEFSCIIYIEHQHNHPIKALQSLSFKSITYLVASSIRYLFEKYFRGGSRAAETTKMECFVIIVKPLTIITKHSILDVAAALDPPLDLASSMAYYEYMQQLRTEVSSELGVSYVMFW